MNVKVIQNGCPACGCMYVKCECTEQQKREAPLRAAAREALTVLTRLADSAHRWAGRDVPVGITAEIDAAKARLAGVLNG
jgi:predicted  nucleic acid-binding Zn-ribbon protein